MPILYSVTFHDFHLATHRDLCKKKSRAILSWPCARDRSLFTLRSLVVSLVLPPYMSFFLLFLRVLAPAATVASRPSTNSKNSQCTVDVTICKDGRQFRVFFRVSRSGDRSSIRRSSHRGDERRSSATGTRLVGSAPTRQCRYRFLCTELYDNQTSAEHRYVDSRDDATTAFVLLLLRTIKKKRK